MWAPLSSVFTTQWAASASSMLLLSCFSALWNTLNNCPHRLWSTEAFYNLSPSSSNVWRELLFDSALLWVSSIYSFPEVICSSFLDGVGANAPLISQHQAECSSSDDQMFSNLVLYVRLQWRSMCKDTVQAVLKAFSTDLMTLIHRVTEWCTVSCQIHSALQAEDCFCR